MERNVAESNMVIVCFHELVIITMNFRYDDRCLVEVLIRHTPKLSQKRHRCSRIASCVFV